MGTSIGMAGGSLSSVVAAPQYGAASPRYTAPLAVFTVLRSSAETELGCIECPTTSRESKPMVSRRVETSALARMENEHAEGFGRRVSDFADRDGVRRALLDIEIAFLALDSSLQQVELEQRFIDVAAEVGLPHLVKLSAADARSDSVASVLRWHAAIESHLAASGIPHTLLSPSAFTDVLMLAAPSIRATDRWSGSAPHGRNALVDSADVVDAAIAVLSEPSKRGTRHVLTGSVALTWPEVAARLTKVLGRLIRYDAISIEERRAQLEVGGLAP